MTSRVPKLQIQPRKPTQTKQRPGLVRKTAPEHPPTFEFSPSDVNDAKPPRWCRSSHQTGQRSRRCRTGRPRVRCLPSGLCSRPRDLGWLLPTRFSRRVSRGMALFGVIISTLAAQIAARSWTRPASLTRGGRISSGCLSGPNVKRASRPQVAPRSPSNHLRTSRSQPASSRLATPAVRGASWSS